MALTPRKDLTTASAVEYIDGTTVIGADNLNKIQRTILYNTQQTEDLADQKQNAEAGKGLSTNDYTTAEKTKLAGIEDGATRTVVDAALSDTSTNPVQNKVVKTLADDVEAARKTALASYITDTVSGSIASFSDGADDVPVKDLTVAIEPVQSGSGDPAPDNVRPITGWTGVNVTRTGKNFLELATVNKIDTDVDVSITEDSITLNGTASSTAILSFNLAFSGAINAKQSDNKKHLPNGTYVFGDLPSGLRYQVYGSNSIDAGGADVVSIANSYSKEPFSIDDTYAYNWIRLWVNGGTVFSNTKIYPMIRLASDTDTTYEPYISDTYSITFPSEAGTVYGGTLDVTTGLLSVNRVTPEQKTGAAWAKVAGYNHIFYVRNSGNKAFGLTQLSTVITNVLPTVVTNGLAAFDGIPYGARVTDAVYVVNQDCSTLEEWNAFVQSSGLQVVYELATPVTYQLSPTEVKTLLGTNNIWADTGDTTAEYRADTKMYIDKQIAALQALVLES